MLSFLIISHILVLGTSAKLTLKCGDSENSNSEILTCFCDFKIDSINLFPFKEAQCSYREINEFPLILNSSDSKNLVTSLDLSHNNLNELKVTQNLVNVNPEILSLKLSFNSIETVDPNFFDQFPNLRHLDLSYNNLSYLGNIFEKLKNLEVLDLSHNKLDSVLHNVPVFGALNLLKSLNLSYNPLGNLLDNPRALTETLGISPDIQFLSLDNVGLTYIHSRCWNSFGKLKRLSVSDNAELTEIPQVSPETLEYLDISGTNVTDLHENFLNYVNLKVLKMNRMKSLTTIPKYSFFNLGNLEEFYMTDSRNVAEFNEYVFGLPTFGSHPRMLKKISLARNRIESLNESYKFIFQELDFVDLSFNPFKCDCDLLWLKDETHLPLIKKIFMRCDSPNENLNKLLLELKPKDLPNCYPEIYGKKFHQTAILLLLLLIFALIVVIVYLCLYSPSWSVKLGGRQISPDSPYSINSQ